MAPGVSSTAQESPTLRIRSDYVHDNMDWTGPSPEAEEVFIRASPDDPDMDGLTTAVEMGIGTDPLNVDSDCDGKDDGTEVGANPGSPTDSDTDGKIDALESNKADTDGDGTPDETDPTTATWQLSCLYFKPFAVKNDQSDSSTVEVRIVGASNPTAVKLSNSTTGTGGIGDVLVGGTASTALGGIPLFDDGTNGDRVASDNIWSRGAITSNANVAFSSNGKTITRGFDKVEVTDDSGTNSKTTGSVREIFANLGVVAPADVTAPTVHATPPGGSPSQRTANLINLISPQGMLAVRRFLIGSPQFTFFPDTYTALQNLTKDFYKTFTGDNFDFFIAFAEKTVNGAAGIHTGVRNDVNGIGKSIFDNTAGFGSAGNLESVIGMNFGDNGPTSHEALHHWGVSLSGTLGFQNCAGGHWGWAGVGKGQLGGFSMINPHDTTPGRFCMDGFTFANGGDGADYVPLELYLMGLVPSGSVPTITTLINPVCGSVAFSDAGCPAGTTTSVEATTTGTTTIGDIITTHGARTGPAPTAFTAAMVVVTQYTLNATEMAFFDVWSEIWGAATGMGFIKSFAQSTGSLATMNTTVPAPPTPPACDDNLQLQSQTINGTQNYTVKNTFTLGPSLIVDGDVTATVGGTAAFLNDTTIEGTFSLTIDPGFCP